MRKIIDREFDETGIIIKIVRQYPSPREVRTWYTGVEGYVDNKPWIV